MEHHFVTAGTDGSRQAFWAVEWAAHEAAMRGATLQLVCVPTNKIIQASEEVLARAADHAVQAEPALAVETGLRSGPPALALAKAAAGASLLVVGSGGSGSDACAALAPGFVSRYVATHARCPVAVVRDEGTAEHREIVVGVREAGQSAAVGFAFEEASLRRARVRVVHAWRWLLPAVRPAVTGLRDPAVGDIAAEVARWLADSLTFWRDKYPDVDVVEEVVHAPAAHALAATSAAADLIILGRNVPDDIRHPESNPVIHAVLNHALCPVAIVPE